jgi:hypothetical protein
MKMNKRQFERLKKVYEVGKTIKPKEFAMDQWWDTTCGSKGCFIGWFCHKNPNLSLKCDSNGVYNSRVKGYVYQSDTLSNYFGITLEEVKSIFISIIPVSKKKALRQLENLIKKYELEIKNRV